jgi:tetratricopeptide (TPR) repeat protein
MNLGDVALLRTAYGKELELPLRRMVGLRLGVELVKTADGAEEGAKLIRAIVADSPDTKGACEAFVALAEHEASAGRWEESEKIYHDAVETWPEAVRLASLQEGRGEVLMKLGKNEDALKAFAEAESLATDDAARAMAVLRQGDVLSELGRGAESMAKYRTVLDRYAQTEVAKRLKKVVEIREMETRGRNLYKDYRFEDAKSAFAKVAAAEPALRPRMDYFEVLCLFGLGRDDEAERKADELAKTCPDAAIRADVALWLAKFTYNRCEWKRSGALFRAFATASPSHAFAPEALLWATRAAFAGNDFKLAIQTATGLVETYPSSPAVSSAFIVQGRALIELARFDEAVLVLERVVKNEEAPKDVRLKAQILKADALFAMGADNPVRYQAALETYREVSIRGEASPDDRIAVAFKIGRTLEKLRRREEADDQYYRRVVLAYRDGRLNGERFGDEARASFSRAAFRLADERERRGDDKAALNVLRLVEKSDVPAAEEAAKRIERISTKGRFR